MSEHYEFTPTTEQVRMDYIQASEGDRVCPEEAGPQFDRWLAAHDAQVRQEAKVQALRDAAQVLREDVDIVFNKHRGIFFREDEADRKGISPWGWLENRADQIEQENTDA